MENNTQSLVELNILIAEWLGWYKAIEGNNHITFYNPDNIAFRSYDLEFHCDSNLQWVCLEKIAKDMNLTIFAAIYWINTKWSLNRESIDSKQELFESIINYINNENKNR